MKPAARLLDPHTCPGTDPAPHLGGTITEQGASSVLIDHLAAATQGSLCMCAVGSAHAITAGSTTVLIEHKAAARMGDPTAHGGTITAGCATVLIGD